jgi:phenylalanine-4-hydroxylase
MEFVSQYISKVPDAQGFVEYDQIENSVWNTLYLRQIKLIQQYACPEFIAGIDALDLSPDHIPQLPEVNKRLAQLTGWEVQSVDALISAEAFFNLLAKRIFPAATFIRTREELDYVKEPDIFHELFGHCPMLTVPIFADFVQRYALMVLASPQAQWRLLQRMFWFTVEFGLIKTLHGMRAYGGGILSSFEETQYCVTSPKAERLQFDPLTILRTPYRIDMLQPVYFVIEDFDQLFELVDSDFNAWIQEAHRLGELPAKFEGDPNDPNIHILAC